MSRSRARKVKLTSEMTMTAETDPLLKLREVGAELNVARITLFRWIRAGKLPAVRVGQQWRVRRSVVEEMKGERG